MLGFAFMLYSDFGVKRTFFGSGQCHPWGLCFRTQESLSAVALKATSTPAVCETLLSLNAVQAKVAFANRVQEAPIEKIKSRSDAISFSRGDVVFFFLRTGLDEFTCQVCVLARTSLGHSGPAPVCTKSPLYILYTVPSWLKVENH